MFLVFDMPVKTDLKLMAPVSSDGADPEWNLFDNVVHELDRTILQAVEKRFVLAKVGDEIYLGTKNLKPEICS